MIHWSHPSQIVMVSMNKKQLIQERSLFWCRLETFHGDENILLNNIFICMCVYLILSGFSSWGSPNSAHAIGRILWWPLSKLRCSAWTRNNWSGNAVYSDIVSTLPTRLVAVLLNNLFLFVYLIMSVTSSWRRPNSCIAILGIRWRSLSKLWWSVWIRNIWIGNLVSSEVVSSFSSKMKTVLLNNILLFTYLIMRRASSWVRLNSRTAILRIHWWALSKLGFSS